MNRDQPPRRIDAPEPCFIRLRLVRNGPWVGARIFFRLGMLAAEINKQPADPHQVWHGGEFIDEARYNILTDPPVPNPYVPQVISGVGIADAMQEQAECDWWMTRPLA